VVGNVDEAYSKFVSCYRLPLAVELIPFLEVCQQSRADVFLMFFYFANCPYHCDCSGLERFKNVQVGLIVACGRNSAIMRLVWTWATGTYAAWLDAARMRNDCVDKWAWPELRLRRLLRWRFFTPMAALPRQPIFQCVAQYVRSLLASYWSRRPFLKITAKTPLNKHFNKQ